MHKELDGSYNRRGEDLMWGQTCVTIVVRVDTERLSVILKGQVIFTDIATIVGSMGTNRDSVGHSTHILVQMSMRGRMMGMDTTHPVTIMTRTIKRVKHTIQMRMSTKRRNSLVSLI